MIYLKLKMKYLSINSENLTFCLAFASNSVSLSCWFCYSDSGFKLVSILFVCVCVFQSGRSPSSSERTMSAHVSTGRVCGQELHPVQNQTSLKGKKKKKKEKKKETSLLGLVSLGPARPYNPKLFSLLQVFSQTIKHFNDKPPLPCPPPSSQNDIVHRLV